MKKLSLSDRIRAAKSANEVESLLQEGRKYEFASQVTKRKWARLASKF